MSAFQEELQLLINKHSIENESDTPDFMLARFVTDCLKAYSETVHRRDGWYGYTPGVNTKERKRHAS